jgi:hypothetical protein
MAVGDVVSGLSSVASGAYLDLRPSAGVEWVLHNVYYGGRVEISFYDGSNEVVFEVDSGPGSLRWEEFHCTNSLRIRVKNVSGGAIYIGYDGVQTK